MQEYERLLEQHASFRDNQRRAERFIAGAIDSGEAERVARRLITIPTVVHVVYKRERENISEAQVKSQIAVLNKDFTAANTDKSKVPAAWKGIVGNAQVKFRLADRDPDGRPTNGITRTKTSAGPFGTGDAVKSDARGGKSPWPTKRYLNMWVCNLAGGLLGYAQFPGGPARTDGVVILQSAFGTHGTAQAPFDKGRTTTHEVGHYLNLFHIFGDTLDCSAGDRCPDTRTPPDPISAGSFPHISCHNGPNGDMFMDYMDYVDDDAMFMFTSGQVVRMNATLAGPRKELAGL